MGNGGAGHRVAQGITFKDLETAPQGPPEEGRLGMESCGLANHACKRKEWAFLLAPSRVHHRDPKDTQC